MDLVLVHGTYGRAEPWHGPGSRLRAEAEARDAAVYDFLWSGVLAGVPTPLPGDPAEAANGADAGALLPWLDAGEKLRLFCQLHHLQRPYVLSHSHGLQVVTFAAIKGQPFSVALSVSGPIRRDMLRARRIARDRIGQWVQFADPTADRFISDGEWFDGDPSGTAFTLPEGVTITTPGTGHTGLLTDAVLREKYAVWEFLVPAHRARAEA